VSAATIDRLRAQQVDRESSAWISSMRWRAVGDIFGGAPLTIEYGWSL
jgi:hypothetical protein